MRKGGRKEGRMEGRNEGRKGRREGGREERRKEGRKKKEPEKTHTLIRGNKCTVYVSFSLNQVLLKTNSLLNFITVTSKAAYSKSNSSPHPTPLHLDTVYSVLKVPFLRSVELDSLVHLTDTYLCFKCDFLWLQCQDCFLMCYPIASDFYSLCPFLHYQMI